MKKSSCLRSQIMRRPLRAVESLEPRMMLAADALLITEINYNPHAEIDDNFADSDEYEFIELKNTGDEAVDLTEVVFASGVNFDFSTGSVTSLAAGDHVVIVKNQQAFEERYGTDINNVTGQYSGTLSNGGERLVLENNVGFELLNFRYDDEGAWPGRPDGRGSSLILKDQDAIGIVDFSAYLDDNDSWRSSVEFGGSPGEEGLGRFEDVVINEVLAHTDLPQTDAIELYNMSAVSVDISGWYLSEEMGALRKFKIPDGTILAPGGYVFYDEFDFNPTLDGGNPGPNDFALSGSLGEELWLIAADDNDHLERFADKVTFGGSLNGETFGRWPDGIGDLAPMTEATLNAENSGPRVGPVIISEVMYNPPSEPAENVDHLEFVEIFNPTGQDFNLTNWTLEGEVDYLFDDGRMLGAGETLVILSFDPEDVDGVLLGDFFSTYDIDQTVDLTGPYSGRLGNGGGRLRLQSVDEPPTAMPDIIPQIFEDEIDYDDKDPWPVEADGTGPSLNRIGIQSWGNDSVSWTTASPTPGSVGVPVAADDMAETEAGVAVVIDVLANDVDPDDNLDPSQVMIVINPSKGSVNIDSTTGAITYTPTGDFSVDATDAFSYTIADDDGQVSNQATVTITVLPNNNLPVALNDEATTDEDQPIVIDVLANDSGDLDATTVEITSDPGSGTLTVETTGEVTYTPSLDFSGTDTFRYRVQDNSGNTSNEVIVTVTVAEVNDSPVADTDFATTNSGVPVSIDVLANDIDVDGIVEPGSVTIAGQPANGFVDVSIETGDITYQSDAGFSGVDIFSYTVDDNDGASSNEATVAVTVNDTSNPPVAANNAASTDEDTPVMIDILANDTAGSAAIDPGSVVITLDPLRGTVSISAETGVVTYTPSGDAFGPNELDTFRYTVADVNGLVSNDAAVNIVIQGVNDPPAGSFDEVTLTEFTSIEIDILANDTDPDGSLDPATVTITNNPSLGSLSIDPATGIVTYTHTEPYFFGFDSFRYTVEDNEGLVSDEVSVGIVIREPNEIPIALDDEAVTEEDTPVLLTILDNDSDVDGTLDVSSLDITLIPSHGSVVLSRSQGTITYRPSTNFSGTDTFRYTINDDDDETSNEATVTVTITPVNDAPSAAADEAMTDLDTTTLIDVLANDVDVDSSIDPTTVTISQVSSHGTVSVNESTGAVLYIPEAGYIGIDTFSYTVADDVGDVSEKATVTISVGANEHPWQNFVNRYDVDDNNIVNSLDLLKIIRDVNANGNRQLDDPTEENSPPPFIDINGDGIVNPLDLALMVTELNRLAGEAESESEVAEGEPEQSYHLHTMEDDNLTAETGQGFVTESLIGFELSSSSSSDWEEMENRQLATEDDLIENLAVYENEELVAQNHLPRSEAEDAITDGLESLELKSLRTEITDDIFAHWEDSEE